jgi:Ca-activated chloride channel family protein
MKRARCRTGARVAVEALIGDRGWAWRAFRLGWLGRWPSVLVLLCAVANIGWLGAERDRAREGNRLYDAGRYDEAGSAYGEGLVDYPESKRLRFNLGAAQYRQGNLADAIATLGKLLPGMTGKEPVGPPPSETPELAAEAAYNVGNARYRLGQRMEEQDPQQAIALYEQALLAYKRAMALDPNDDEPKFNHEFVARHEKELKERLEEQQRQKEQEKQKQQQEQEQQEQQQKEDEQGGQEQQQSGEEKEQNKEGAQAPESKAEAQDGQKTPEQQEKPKQPESGEEQAGSQQNPQEQAQQDGGAQQDKAQEKGSEGRGEERAGAAGETGAEPAGDEMTSAEARTLIDAARGEEVDPSEVQHQQVGIAGIGEPREDW